MTYVRRCRLHGAIVATLLLSACSDSGNAGTSGQNGGTDTDQTRGSTSNAASSSESVGDSTSSDHTPSSTSSSSGGLSGTETSGSPSPECCSADCSICQDECATETLHKSNQTLSEAIAVFNEQLFWAGGASAELRRYDGVTGETQLLGTFGYGMDTMVANEVALYFGSRSSAYPVIGNVDPTTGETSELWVFDEGLNTGSGQMALDDTHLYFSVSEASEQGNGGVFRISLEGGPPERIAQSHFAPGLGLDDSHVFFADAANARVFSLAKGDIGSETLPSELALTLDPGELFVGNEFIYYTSSTGLDRVSKRGQDFTQLLGTSAVVSGLTGDETHLYATILGGDRVVRVQRGTENPEVVDLADDGHLAIAVTCDALYWVTDNGELRRRQK